MVLFILGVISIFIVSCMALAGVLLWLEKSFKIENPTYKIALKIVTFSSIVGLILSILSSILSFVASFFVFHYLLDKYYTIGSWKKSLKIYFLFWIIGAVLTAIIIIPIRFYIFSPFAIDGEAMSPTYNNGDYLLVNKLSDDFVRGDVVIFKTDQKPGSFFIKRIIGLPLEKVDIQSGRILINGQIFNESYYNGETLPDSSVILGQDQYFVLGDNRGKSSDSRNFGPIVKSNIDGKVFYNVPGLISWKKGQAKFNFLINSRFKLFF